MKLIALAAVAGAASSATAQDLIIDIFPISGDTFGVVAEFQSIPPTPIVQIWADASFTLSGSAPITISSYNPAYDTSLGNAQLIDNGTNNVQFVGNANSFFGTPDSSNPLQVLTFDYSGSLAALSLNLVGQNSAIFELPPFGDVRLYQDAQGNPGELTFGIHFIPAPASAALLGLGGLCAARRRR